MLSPVRVRLMVLVAEGKEEPALREKAEGHKHLEDNVDL